MKWFFENENIVKSTGLWLVDDCDSVGLAEVAEYALHTQIPVLSVMPNDINVIWPWVENLNIKLFARFYIKGVNCDTVPELVMNIKNSFKHGADGAQIIMKLCDLERFANLLLPIRDDLFFNKDLSIGLDIFEIWPLDWEKIFMELKKLNITSLLLIMSCDEAEKSDFTGRLYAALQSWDVDTNNMQLHIMVNESYNRVEQVDRLIAKVQPNLLNKIRFFIGY